MWGCYLKYFWLEDFLIVVFIVRIKKGMICNDENIWLMIDIVMRRLFVIGDVLVDVVVMWIDCRWFFCMMDEVYYFVKIEIGVY